MSKLNKGNIKPANGKEYLKKIHRKIYIILGGWFFFVICFGWVLCCFVSPPDLFLDFYSNYRGYVKEYNLFCMSMMLAVFTSPMVFWLLFCVVPKTAESPSLKLKILLMTVASLLVFLTTGIDGLEPIEQGGRKKDPRTLAILLFDWQGAVLLNLFLFAFFIFIAILSLKPKEK